MTKLSISLHKHQQRDDKTFPVAIKIAHLSQKAYINTGRSAQEKQVTQSNGKKSALTIKDTGLQRDVLNIMKLYEVEMEKMGNLSEYTAKEIAAFLQKKKTEKNKPVVGLNLLSYCFDYANKLDDAGKINEAKNFRTLGYSLEDLVRRPILYTTEINKAFLKRFAEFLQTERIVNRCTNQGNLKQTTLQPCGEAGIYNRMKDLRTIFNKMREQYNDADEDETVIPNYPFAYYKLTQPKTEPRGVYSEDLIKIYKLYDKYFDMTKKEQTGIDLFFLSFLLVGMNAVDFWNIPKEAMKGGRLTYSRSKTKDRRQDKAITSIKIEPEATAIMEKYFATEGSYLFTFHNKYKQSSYLNRAIDDGLKSLCEKNELNPVTMYVARHSWATIARNRCGVSKDDVNFALNHVSDSNGKKDLADIYVKTDWSFIDRANRKVIDDFLGNIAAS